MYELLQIRERLADVPDPVALLEGLFAFSPFGLQVYRADGQSLLTNKAFRELFGSEPPPEYNVLTDEIAREQGILALIHRAFRGETVTPPAIWYDPRELRQVKVSEGRRVAFSATFFPIFDREAKVSHVAIVFKDETANILAREELIAAERRAKLLADASAVLAESLDATATLTRLAHLVVPQLADWCTVTVLDASDQQRRVAVVHRDPSQAERVELYLRTFPPSQHRTELHDSVSRSGRSVFLPEVDEATLTATAQTPEHVVLLKGLGIRSCMMVPLRGRGKLLGVISLMRGEGSPPFSRTELALAEDLASRAALAVDNGRLFDAEHQARKALEEAVRARDEFLSIASHELRTPLTSLSLQLSVARRITERGPSGPERDAQLTSKLAVIERQVQRLDALINNLLDISRLTANRLALELTEVDLVPVLREVAGRFADQLIRAGCTLKLELPESSTGRWDSLRLEQILTNLLTNAMKYGRDKPIEIMLENIADVAVLRIRDHGIGIAPEDQARIFERFERAAPGAQYAGLGLGLWITRQLVEALGGHITVLSAPGEGATFTVQLPRRGPES